jgi:hypothetical protein
LSLVFEINQRHFCFFPCIEEPEKSEITCQTLSMYIFPKVGVQKHIIICWIFRAKKHRKTFILSFCHISRSNKSQSWCWLELTSHSSSKKLNSILIQDATSLWRYLWAETYVDDPPTPCILNISFKHKLETSAQLIVQHTCKL